MVGEACLPSNAYYPRTPDYTLCSGIHVCWSEHSDSSFVYGFMILNYGFGTMTTTTYYMELGQGQIIQKPNKQELSFMFITHHLNVMHASVNFHKYIPYGLGVMAHTWFTI